MDTRRTLRLVAIPALVGASLIGGFAAAVFTLSATTTATGTVASAARPTITAHVDGVVWPGECADVAVVFENGNDRPVVIDRVAGTITRQPSAGDHGQGKDQGNGNDPVAWGGAADALAGREIAARGSKSLTIPDAVCLSPKAGGEVAGKDLTASVTFDFHVPPGEEFPG